MATISSPALKIENVNNTTVKLTVSYTLIPSAIEKLAGTVFSENIKVIGDDPGVFSDITIATFPGPAVFAVSSGTPSGGVLRTRVIPSLAKSLLNEDPAFEPTGAELGDQIFAQINVVYAANAPVTPTLPSPTQTNFVKGAWK